MPDAPSFVALIDDNESVCLALSRLLRLAGYTVRSYYSGESFLDDPERGYTRLVVSDVYLLGMSGLDLQRTLRHEVPGVPFAFITAHDDPDTQAQAEASGCVAYLRKPFPGQALLDAIKALPMK